MPERSTLAITYGSVNRAFQIVGPVQVRVKPRTGALQRATGQLLRADIIDTPVAIRRFTGIGLSRNDSIENRVTGVMRLWDAANVCTMFAGTLVSLGPLKQSPTFTGGPTTYTSLGNGFTETAEGTLWMHGAGTAATDEPLHSLVSTTWTNSTANADIAGDVNTCIGIVWINGTFYAISRDSWLSGGNRRYVFKSTSAGGAWSEDFTTAAHEFTGGDDDAYFLENIGTTLYTMFYRANTQINIATRTAGTAGSAWTQAATLEEDTDAGPRGMVKFHDRVNVVDFFVATHRQLFWYDVSAATFTSLWKFRNPDSAYTGRLVVSPIEDAIYFTDGPNVGRFSWGDSGGINIKYIGPASLDNPQAPWTGLPTSKSGNVTAITVSKKRLWLYVTVGGLAASRFAWSGIYDTVLGEWHVPYANTTAQRAITAVYEFSETLRIMEEQAAGGDQDPRQFLDIVNNPATTANYAHATEGQVVLAKDDRLLPELNGVWLKIEAIGTGLTASNQINGVFGSADAAVLDLQSSWTTLGAITANAGSQNFTATPAGTGQSARAMQCRVDLSGVSDASPYIEQLTIYVRKDVPVKYLRSYTVDLVASSNSSSRTRQAVLDELEAIVVATSYLSVTYGQEDAIVMTPWLDGDGPLAYVDEPSQKGTAQTGHMDVKTVILTLAEV